MYRGNQHTFSAVGEEFTFTVPIPPGTFRAGDLVIISASEDINDVTPCNNGSEGFISRTVYGYQAPIPTIGSLGQLLMILSLMLAGGLVISRRVTS